MLAFPFQPRETPVIFERSREGRPGTAVPKPIVAKRAADVLPAGALRATTSSSPSRTTTWTARCTPWGRAR